MGPTEFDFAVIEYSEELGVISQEVYRMVDEWLPFERGNYQESELLDALEAVKRENNLHTNPDLGTW